MIKISQNPYIQQDLTGPKSEIFGLKKVKPRMIISWKMVRISQNPYIQQDLTGPKSEIFGF